MNLPNKLTILRVLLIPFFILFFFWSSLPLNFLWALIIFSAASITDTLDGHIARKNNLVTNFGKLMDPLADKLLVISALVCILGGGYFHIGFSAESDHVIGLIGLIIILAREFTVTSIRLVAAEKGVVIAADKWGKFKTVSQMVWTVLLLLRLVVPTTVTPASLTLIWSVALNVLFVIMIVLTVGSGFNYVWNNRELISDTGEKA